jgi:ACS family hexuronate transporter-like MFS transporter
MGLPLIVIYLTADVGSVGGGALSSWLIARGMAPIPARLTAMLICALCILSIIAAAGASSLWLAVAAISLAIGAHQAWTANIWSLVMDFTPKEVVGSVFGFGSMIGAVGGMFMTQIVGYVLTVTNNNYSVLFTLIPCCYFVALTWLYFMAPRQVETLPD